MKKLELFSIFIFFSIFYSFCNGERITSLDPQYTFAFEVPPVVEIVMTSPKINRSTAMINNIYANEKRIIIGNHHYYKAKTCGIHFLNRGEGYILNDKLFNEFPADNERCLWAFVGSQFCTPSINCIKFQKRSSNCRQNYLQISDGGESFAYHFCNEEFKPNLTEEYYSESGVLDVTYRYSKKHERPDFECRVQCVPYKVNFTSTKNADNLTIVKVMHTNTFVEKIPPLKKLRNCNCGIANINITRDNDIINPLKKKPRVLGGREAQIHQYPWMAAIKNKNKPIKELPFCGGSLISSEYVLTASHCISDEEVDDLIVVLKEHDFYNQTETTGNPIISEVSEIIPFPYYLESTFYGDLALIRLSKPVNIRSYTLTPICLPKDPTNLYNDVDVLAAGWGTEVEFGPKSHILKEVLLRVFSNQGCNDYHPATPPEPIQITDNMLCAGFPEGQRDTCWGDSGGPLFAFENKRFTQIGVTSWGYSCGLKSNPGVFSRVTCNTKCQFNHN